MGQTAREYPGRYPQTDPTHLTLTQQFTAAAFALSMGIAAAYGVNETIVPLLNAVHHFEGTAFFINFSAMFAVTGGTLGWTEQTLRQKNEKYLRTDMNAGIFKKLDEPLL